MPHTPKINRRALGKTGLFDEDRFYSRLAENCGYIDKETAKRFYLGMVKQVTQELREHGVARLPHLGDFALVWQKSKPSLVGASRVMLPEMQVLKFYAKETWRKYFSDLKNRT